jgi:hypothetical protein
VGLPEQIDEFDDRPGGMTDGEEGARVGANGTMRGLGSADLWPKLHYFSPNFGRMIDAKNSVYDASMIRSAKY